MVSLSNQLSGQIPPELGNLARLWKSWTSQITS